MITQQPENEIQQKASVPSLVMERRWVVALFSFMGIVLPLVAGLILSWPWNLEDLVVLLTLLLAAFVSVAVGASLLCFAFGTWWTAVFAGGAWLVGEFLGALQRQLVESGWPALQTWQPFWSGQVNSLSLELVLLLLAMMPGVVCGLWLRQRRVARQ